LSIEIIGQSAQRQRDRPPFGLRQCGPRRTPAAPPGATLRAAGLVCQMWLRSPRNHWPPV